MRGRIIAAFGLLVIILMGVAAGSAWQVREHRVDIAAMEEHADTAFVLQNGLVHAEAAASGVQRYVMIDGETPVAGDEDLISRVRGDMAEAQESMAQAIADAEARGDREQAARFYQISAEADSLVAGVEMIIALQQSGDTQAAASGLEVAVLPFREFEEKLEAAAETELNTVSALRGRADRAGALALWLLIISGAAGAVLGLATSVIVARSIIKPLSSLEATAIAVSKGDLEARAEASGPRELARLGSALNQMTESLLDASKRRELEEALRYSEQYFRTLVEDASDVVMLLDADGTVRYISPAVRHALGWEVEELVGTNAFGRILHEDDLPALSGALTRVMKDPGAASQMEARVRHRDGSWRNFEGTLRNSLDDPAVAGLVLNCRDVTERKRAEEALQVSETKFRTMADTAAATTFIYQGTRLRYVNPATEALTGYTRDELLKMKFWDVIHPDSRQLVRERGLARQRGEDAPGQYETKVLTKGGEERWVEFTLGVIEFEGNPAVLGTGFDITERKRAEEALRVSEERLRKQNRTLAELAKSKTLNLGDLNAAVREITEAAAHAFEVERASVWLFSDDRSKVRCVDLYELSAGCHSEGVELAGVDYPSYFKALEEERTITAHDAHTDPRTKEFSDSYLSPLGITSMLDATIRVGGHLAGVICYEHVGPARKWSLEEQNLAGSMADFVSLAMETHERRRADEALKVSETKFRTLADTVAAAAFIYRGTRLLYVNPATEALTGYTRDELLDMNGGDVIHPDFREMVKQMGPAREGGEDVPRQYECKLLTKSGEERWVDFTMGVIEFEGKPAVLGTAFEITERKRAEETIKHLAYHDSLTDLPNRTLFNDRLTVALAQAPRNKRMLTVMYLDLDQFKVVNDTVGHGGGDELLRSVAERLMGLVRDGDTLARMGGDEFAILSPEIASVDDAHEVAERVLEGLRRPWVIQGQEFRVTTSIGIALYPSDGDDAETLLRNADTAMYRAKEHGRDNYQLYTPAMNARIAERLAVESSLRHSLDRGEFVVHYQPQVDLRSGQVVGTEALVRWQHPERGLVAPAEFIPVAEDTGLIVPLGEWVLRTACAQNKAWQEEGIPPLRVSVNLSARQFQQRNLIDMVAQVLEETGLDPHRLQLEITEGVAMKDTDFTIDVLQGLRAMGVQIAMDDFGTGYSSLSYLKRLPFKTVKIDRSFVRDLTVDLNDAAIAAAIIAMAHNLKLNVIAEGVETVEQLALLKRQGCDEMQGYLFSRPGPPDVIGELLRKGGEWSRSKIAIDSPRTRSAAGAPKAR